MESRFCSLFQCLHSHPPGCPPDAQYVPQLQRTQLIHSAHSSLGTGHPGSNATLSLLKDRYWWPNMAREERRFVQGCEECAISKSPRHLPAGKLLPLSIPNQPWSHLMLFSYMKSILGGLWLLEPKAVAYLCQMGKSAPGYNISSLSVCCQLHVDAYCTQ